LKSKSFQVNEFAQLHDAGRVTANRKDFSSFRVREGMISFSVEFDDEPLFGK
jgi:hypothetical protein